MCLFILDVKTEENEDMSFLQNSVDVKVNIFVFHIGVDKKILY